MHVYAVQLLYFNSSKSNALCGLSEEQLLAIRRPLDRARYSLSDLLIRDSQTMLPFSARLETYHVIEVSGVDSKGKPLMYARFAMLTNGFTGEQGFKQGQRKRVA